MQAVATQVRYGNTTNAPSSNATYLGVRLTLTLRYPQPEMVPSEQAAIANIYSQCVTISLRFFSYACCRFLCDRT